MTQNGQLSYDNNILQELVICGNGIYIWDHLSSDKWWQNRDYLLRNNHNFVCARCHNGNEFSIDLMIFFISINTLTIVCNVTLWGVCYLMSWLVLSVITRCRMWCSGNTLKIIIQLKQFVTRLLSLWQERPQVRRANSFLTKKTLIKPPDFHDFLLHLPCKQPFTATDFAIEHMLTKQYILNWWHMIGNKKMKCHWHMFPWV